MEREGENNLFLEQIFLYFRSNLKAAINFTEPFEQLLHSVW